MNQHSSLSKLEKTIEELKESESRYKCLFENVHTIMLIINPETGDILDANPGAVSFYGWPYGEIIQKNIAEINLLSKQEILQKMEEARQQNRKHFLFKHRLSTGDIRHVEVHSGPIVFSGKKFLYSIIHDITDKLANERIAIEKEKLAAVISTIGAVCHEMNQPLMSILGYSELLIEESSNGKDGVSYIEEIKKQTVKLGEITHKLMDVTEYKTKKYLKSEILDIDAASKK